MGCTMFRFGTALGMIVLLSGCFARPDPGAHYGELPSDYQTQAVAYFQDVLKDPDSAKYQFGTPRRAYGNNGLVYGGNVAFTGWAVPVAINAKNSFGGYTGFEPFLVIFVDGRVYTHLEGYEPTLITFVD
jgi:hypothetical protein